MKAWKSAVMHVTAIIVGDRHCLENDKFKSTAADHV
jgi:hypothetical protein